MFEIGLVTVYIYIYIYIYIYTVTKPISNIYLANFLKMQLSIGAKFTYYHI